MISQSWAGLSVGFFWFFSSVTEKGSMDADEDVDGEVAPEPLPSVSAAVPSRRGRARRRETTRAGVRYRGARGGPVRAFLSRVRRLKRGFGSGSSCPSG